MKIKIRRDTTANWTSNNPTLDDGEIGVERLVGGGQRIKIGVANTAWNSLAYVEATAAAPAWGDITGTLADQADLDAALAALEPADATILKDADIGVTVAPAFNNVYAVGYVTPNMPLTFAQGGIYTCTATATPTTWDVPTGLPAAGPVASWILELTNGGLSTQTFTNVTWDSGTQPTLTAAGTDIIAFYTYDQGATIRGFLAAVDTKL
jgi:hypothetical protein